MMMMMMMIEAVESEFKNAICFVWFSGRWGDFLISFSFLQKRSSIDFYLYMSGRGQKIEICCGVF